MPGGMWQPAAGPDMSDVFAILAATNAKVVELQRELVWVNGMVWDMYKQLEAAREAADR